MLTDKTKYYITLIALVNLILYVTSGIITYGLWGKSNKAKYNRGVQDGAAMIVSQTIQKGRLGLTWQGQNIVLSGRIIPPAETEPAIGEPNVP